MLIIGDVHGKIKQYEAIITRADSSIQVGDMGIGFVEVARQNIKHRFIRGNHDNPDLCRQHSNYLGEYGYLHEYNIFFVSGAYSIDRLTRTPGIDWWADEELNHDQFDRALVQYSAIKPKIMVTHDCPHSVGVRILSKDQDARHPKVTRTSHMLETMFKVHQPEHWLCGHHHMSYIEKINDTTFVCLDELGTYEI